MARAVSGLSPVSRITRGALLRNASTTSRACGLSVSARAMAPDRAAVGGNPEHRERLALPELRGRSDRLRSTPESLRNASEPTSTIWPSTFASTPCPRTAWNSPTSRPWANSARARARGCSLLDSAAAATLKSRSRSQPPAG